MRKIKKKAFVAKHTTWKKTPLKKDLIFEAKKWPPGEGKSGQKCRKVCKFQKMSVLKHGVKKQLKKSHFLSLLSEQWDERGAEPFQKRERKGEKPRRVLQNRHKKHVFMLFFERRRAAFRAMNFGIGVRGGGASSLASRGCRNTARGAGRIYDADASAGQRFYDCRLRTR